MGITVRAVISLSLAITVDSFTLLACGECPKWDISTGAVILITGLSENIDGLDCGATTPTSVFIDTHSAHLGYTCR